MARSDIPSVVELKKKLEETLLSYVVATVGRAKATIEYAYMSSVHRRLNARPDVSLVAGAREEAGGTIIAYHHPPHQKRQRRRRVAIYQKRRDGTVEILDRPRSHKRLALFTGMESATPIMIKAFIY